MTIHKFILLDIQPDYPLKNIKPQIYYSMTIDKQEKRYYLYFFILNGNIYLEMEIYKSACDTAKYYCCSIEKFKNFLLKTDILQFFKFKRKTELETVNDLYIMLMECGYKRKINFEEYCEAKAELKSDFRSRYKFEDFKFVVSTNLNPPSHPGDALITKNYFGATITLDMISDRRKQPVPDSIKDEISYWVNKMLEENLIDVKDVHFLLHADIEFEVIGTLYKTYRIHIIMVDNSGNQLHKARFCLCDYRRQGLENVMEEYFKNELFP